MHESFTRQLQQTSRELCWTVFDLFGAQNGIVVLYDKKKIQKKWKGIGNNNGILVGTGNKDCIYRRCLNTYRKQSAVLTEIYLRAETRTQEPNTTLL